MRPGPGRYSRGYLPHFDGAQTPQFITWRLADTLPNSLYDQWRREVSNLVPDEQNRVLTSRVEQHCDSCYGECLLKDELAARAMQQVLRASHGSECILHSWVVMPNHVHVLATPAISLGQLVKLLKGRSAREINRVLKRTGRLWQPDFFDRAIRSEEAFHRIANYIEWNPVKAGLCSDPVLWTWSSANAISRALFEETLTQEHGTR